MRFSPVDFELLTGVGDDEFPGYGRSVRFFPVEPIQLDDDFFQPQVPGRGRKPARNIGSNFRVDENRRSYEDRDSIPLKSATWIMGLENRTKAPGRAIEDSLEGGKMVIEFAARFR